ncbi:unnamed protein product [Ranitomeya imitator]|uniref:AP-3 complex subunit beta C-terminal domain-containing protein n=1 Tax=Ranitomeya imitator TaxID=111125 RepID=A0ABN9LED0_9NEOB|nr:unnamed protein product [Ranitomeya imitator]
MAAGQGSCKCFCSTLPNSIIWFIWVPSGVDICTLNPVIGRNWFDRDHFQLGTLSHTLNAKASGYLELSDWPEVAPDPSARNVEVIEPATTWTTSVGKPKKEKAKSDKFYSSEEDEEEDNESASSSDEGSGSEEDSDDQEESSSEDNEGSSSSEDDESSRESYKEKDSESEDEKNGIAAHSDGSGSSASDSSFDSSSDSGEGSGPVPEAPKSLPKPKKTERKPAKEKETARKKDVSLLDLDDFNDVSTPVALPKSAILSPSLLSDLQGLSLSAPSPVINGDKVPAPRKDKMPFCKCSACASKLPSAYKKKLCQPCTDEVLRSEQPFLLDSIRTLIKQEVQSSMAALSQALTPQPPPPKKRKMAPIDSDSGEIHTLGSEDIWENEGSISTPKSDNKKSLLFRRYGRANFHGEGHHGVEENVASHAVQDDMFGRLKPRTPKGFPIHENIENLVLHEWGLLEKGLSVPSELKNRFPLDGDYSLWKMPKVDVQVSRVTKKTALPFEDSSQLKDPMDRKIESLLRKSWDTSTNLLKTNVASTCVARSLFLWLRTLENHLSQGTSREEILNSPPLLQKATLFLADASAESVRQGICIIPCLDDFLIVAPSIPRLNKDVTKVLDILKSLGWIPNLEKSDLHPSSRKKFPGVLLDSKKRMSFLPRDRHNDLVHRISRFRSQRNPTLRDSMSILGSLTSCIQAVSFSPTS